MDIIDAINQAISTLKKTHVSGDEAMEYAGAINLLTDCVAAIHRERARMAEANRDDGNDQQG